MAAKTKSNPLSGMHTAGIFSDMSVDGPEIGTLVIIADRAKNLPNRKTIGKQDPYCAARLGKEAKKTTTDIRGGQTPKWDQELRFTVHDSPDYYQLKLSIFNDDKKTDLIGETWVDLRDIIVSGGGQNDQWQTLNFKGKYAGEIRIELTFYDSRPKPDKPVAKAKPAAAASELDGAAEAQSGRTPVKRRPLPSNPGSERSEHAPLPKAVPEHVQTPPRAQPNPPAPTFIPNQSPLQAVEYNTPPSSRYNQPDHHSPAPDHAGQYRMRPRPRPDPQPHRSMDRNDKFAAAAFEDGHQFQPEPHSQLHEPERRGSYNPGQPAYDAPSPSAHLQRQVVPDDDRPPPPPVHRIRNNSGNSHEMVHRGSFESPSHKAGLPMRHDVLRSEAHRHSVSSPSSSYPGRPTYRPYDSAPDVPRESIYDQSPPRHQSYDAAFEVQSRSLQPTVEDVPETWTPPNARPRLSNSYQEKYEELHLDHASSPAPLNIGGRGSAASSQYSPLPTQQQRQHSSIDYGSSASMGAARDYTLGNPGHFYPNSYSGHSDPYGVSANELNDTQARSPNSYTTVPPVPSTLVPRVDQALSTEISTRFYEDRRQNRYTQPQPAPVTPPIRGRQYSEPPNSFGVQPSPHGHFPSHSRSYGGSPAAYASGPNTPSGPPPAGNLRGRTPSPNPNHTIKRKSISPAPPPDRQDGRRLSGVPFGPDSYDALNPVVASAKESSKSNEYTNANGKIITPDGREIDPSDHLPMDTWAPEPEPKLPKQKEQPPRSSPAGAQPMPPSGRRQLRIQARPQSMIAPPPTYISPEIEPSPPPSSGRNRLQKKIHRASAMPAPMPTASSPLGPAMSHQRNSTPPRALVRASTFDYENNSLPYGGGPVGAPRGSDSGPPIPAKVPLMRGALVHSASTGGPRGGDEWALMEEMSRIDIGSGRARRHGGY